MGMYDYVRVEVPLPDDYDGDGEFQTKDFECMLATHCIRADGLYIDNGHIEEVPKNERPYPDAPDDDIRSFWGSTQWVPNLEHQPTSTGDVNFCGSDRNKVVRFYVATFCEGALIEIVRTR